MAVEHLVFGVRQAFGTWATPDMGLEVESSSVKGARPKIDLRYTGSGRSLRRRVAGAVEPGGDIATAWWPRYIGYWLASFMSDVAVSQPDGTGAPNTYDHGFLFDDTANFYGINMQQQHTSTFAENILTAVVNQMTITAAKKDIAKLGFSVIPRDFARAGQNWHYSGSASEAIIASGSITYFPVTLRPFIFYDATVTLGGTPALNDTENKVTVTGGTAYNLIENVEVTFALNVDPDAFGLTRDPTRQVAVPGDRTITVAFDIDWSQASNTFYDAWVAGTEPALQLDFQGPAAESTYYYEGHLILPKLSYDGAPPPDLSGSQARKIQRVELMAVYDETTGVDSNVWVRALNDSSYTT